MYTYINVVLAIVANVYDIVNIIIIVLFVIATHKIRKSLSSTTSRSWLMSRN